MHKEPAALQGCGSASEGMEKSRMKSITSITSDGFKMLLVSTTLSFCPSACELCRDCLEGC